MSADRGGGNTFIWRCSHCKEQNISMANAPSKFCSFCGLKPSAAGGGATPQELPLCSTCGQHHSTEDECQFTDARNGEHSNEQSDSLKGSPPIDEERTADERRNGAAGGTPKLETKGNNEGKKDERKGTTGYAHATRHGTTRPAPQVSDPDISGVSPPAGKKIAIVFHVLVPARSWKWTNECHVHLRFSHTKMGCWKKNVGDFEIARKMEDYLEFQCHLEIHREIFMKERGVAYKYIVASGKKNKYENLYGLPSPTVGVRNRYLEFSELTLPHHRYDGLIYPDSEKSGITKLFEYIFTSGSVEPPSQEFLQLVALKVYLQVYKDEMCELKFSSDVEFTTRKMMSIFQSLRHVSSYVDKAWGSSPDVFNCSQLPEEMKKFLLETAEQLYSIDMEGNALNNGKRMLATITIICCLKQMTIRLNEISDQHISLLLSMLRLMPDVHRKKCDDWDYVVALIPQSFKKTVYDSVFAFTKHLCNSKIFDLPQWLFAVPVVHFLKPAARPFQELELDPSNIPWGDKLIGLQYVKSQTYVGSALIVEKFFEDLKLLVIADPLLLYGFIDICPKKDFRNLISRISPFFSIASVGKQIQDAQSINKYEIQIISNHLTTIDDVMKTTKEGTYQMRRAIVKSSLYLAEQAFAKVLKGQEEFLRLVFTVFLRSIELFGDIKADVIKEDLKKLGTLFEKCTSKLLHPFGAGKYFWSEEHARLEIKLWSSVISISVASEVLCLWRDGIATEMIRKRLQKVKLEKRIDLMKIMDTVSNCENVIVAAIVNAVVESISKFTRKDVDQLLSLSPKQKKNVGKIFDHILERQYPGNITKITFEDVLLWDIWKSFMKIHGNIGVAEFNLSEKCIKLCKSAKSVLAEMCDSLESGDITLKKLSYVNENKDDLKKLLHEAMPDRMKKLEQLLKERLQEQAFFTQRLHYLQRLCQTISIEVTGLKELQSEIDSDHSSKPINTLCQKSGGEVTFLSLRSASPLDFFSEKFDIMTSTLSSLFQVIWEKHMKNAANSVKREEREDVTVNDIKILIWDKAFEECDYLLSSLKDRTMKLDEVDGYFRSIKMKELTWQLRRLCSGVHKCVGTYQGDEAWIDSAVQHIKDYWTSLTLSKAAAVVITLKNKLCLTGDFVVVETLANQVKGPIGDRQLSSIDESLIDAGSFLQDHMSNSSKLHCLKAFADSFTIVDWLRKETPQGVDDLHKFVSVALHTAAGEGDIANDNLSRLKIVGSGFSPLIYDLQQDPSFSNFKGCCMKVWDELRHTSDLPAKLMSCNEDIEWYKSVKDTQASVEVTAYGQMNNIFEYGCYKVGTKRPTICKHHHEVISLALKESKKTEKRLSKKNYNLEDLRDLESKLVLITGRNAENRKMVDLFVNTFHSVCHIAELLIDLQQFGNVRYTGWTLQVPCSTSEAIVDSLQNQAKKMERELSDWKKTVNHARQEFYELNYFTTIQLLTLRRELSMERASSDIVPNVLFLLQSISSQITSIGIRELVKKVATVMSSSDFVLQVDEQKEAAPASQPVLEMPKAKVKDPSTKVPQAKACADIPELTENELTENQRNIMVYVVRQIDCSRLLVLKAFEELHGENDKYDYRQWCSENLDTYDFEDDDVSHSEEEEDQEDDATSSSDSESDAFEDEFVYSRGTGHIEAVEQIPEDMSFSFEVVTIESEMEEPVDENHPVVKDLVSANYTLEQSIDAVERYETLEAAIDYLDQQALDDDGDDDDVIPSKRNYKKQSSDDDHFEAKMTWQYGGPPTIHADNKAEGRYLSLKELGEVLKCLSQTLPGEIQRQRPFPFQVLKEGSPNLLVVEPDLVLRYTLSFYMEDGSLPLPTLEEVLVCNPDTTAEEIELFWMRAISDPEFRRIFCLVHAEKLSYQVSDQALRSLSLISQEKEGYRLVIICSNEEEEKSHFIAKLYLFRRPVIPRHEIQEYTDYLAFHFRSLTQDSVNTPASSVDIEQSCVRFVKSARSGMGKSLYLEHLADNLKHAIHHPDGAAVHVTIPLHGPVVTADHVLNLLKDHAKNPACFIYHIDIAPNVLWQVDTLLFSLLVLRGLCDSLGRMWRCHPNQLYVVEVTMPNHDRTSKHFPESKTMSLMKLMPCVSCLSPHEMLDCLEAEDMSDISHSLVLMDDREFKGAPFQRVYQYIRRYTYGKNLDGFSFSSKIEGTAEDYLELLLQYCGVRNPSWSEIRYFVKFLNIQLKSCEESVFTDSEYVGDVMAGLKGFVVKFMINMSRDFSTSSLQGEAKDAAEAMDDDINKYQIDDRKQWEQSPHPYIFFNRDQRSITFVGFTVSEEGHLLNPTTTEKLEPPISMTPELCKGLKKNKVNLQENYKDWTKSEMIVKLSTVMGIQKPEDPDEAYVDPDKTYVLTIDNVIKILAIQMRFRCGIPVVIMGETGCGKTRLIRYMCDLSRQGMKQNNMMILKVHGGTTEDNITRFIQQAEQKSLENKKENLDTVVFFDEANTTDAIGLIKEIMCDRRINGRPISTDLKFIAACNPYRRHSADMIKRLESAGLGFFVQATETQQKLGKIPLRQLVYRVLDLPPSMRPLVYDFGQLNTGTESDYIWQIVNDHIQADPQLREEQEGISRPIADVLAYSQKYMRERKDECSFVSLRDVERTMIVFKYLYRMMNVLGPLMDKYAKGERRLIDNKDEDDDEFRDYESPGDVSRALVLSVSVCYHARLTIRKEYEEGVAKYFTHPIELVDGPEQFRNEIRWCQEVLLDHMQLGDNIARNAALRENVFMMAICVELRIPLFLVGKPGSSKSLAKAIISESMRGKNSKNELLKKFKDVGIFSYQCSQLSTSESVIEVFNNASKFQAKQDMKSYVAVVVLDEVGLAEDSPNLPLKALHPLLEDGTEGARKDFTDEVISRQERVAFIGISNWALDPAKMNRGVMVTRADPSEDELVFSAKGICSNRDDDPIRQRLEKYFKPLAQAYIGICENQEREFFGLRDFYSLIKMLYYMCQKSNRLPTWPQLEHAIKRNFGGLETKQLIPFEVFSAKIHMDRSEQDLSDVSEELHSVLNPDCSRLGLIKTSLSPQEKTWDGESRYVLFLTENYAALDILKNPKNYLEEGLSISGAADVQPFILFGSSFPKDKEYTQVCRNINQIKICMETGRTVILLNLENLYESLYDVLNQYYIYHAKSKYVDLGLQTHRVKCRVNENFKLILIAEKDTVHKKFPTPLINRLEKHFVLTSTILNKSQGIVLELFEDWISNFSDTGDPKFKRSDAFVGFQKDTPASVVFQASNLIRLATTEAEDFDIGHQERLFQLCGFRVEYMSDEEDQNEVLQLSKCLLLQTASPDAIVRLKNTDLIGEMKMIEQIYFQHQHHNSIEDFLEHHVHGIVGLLMQVTTHSHLLSQDELRRVREVTNINIASFYLHEFDTELDFSNKIGPMFKISEESGPEQRLVIIQCDVGHLNGDLIACARYRIYDLRAKADDEQITHTLFIINLPRHVANSSFIGFQGDPWISSHIDDLRPTSENEISANEAIGLTISELFLGQCTPEFLAEELEEQYQGDDFEESGEQQRDLEDYEAEEEEVQEEEKEVEEEMEVDNEVISLDTPPREQAHLIEKPPSRIRLPLFRRMRGCVQAAASKLKDFSTKRSTKRVEILVHLIPKEPPIDPDFSQFHGMLINHVCKVLQKRDVFHEEERDWVVKEAMNPRSLQHGGTFQNALSRKFDEVIIPILSEIICTIDQNYNLDLIDPKNVNPSLSQFWLSMFRKNSIMQFNYTEMVAPREQVPGVGGRKAGVDYMCQLPFSWLIYEAVDSLWDDVKSSAGDNRIQLYKLLCKAVEAAAVGEVLGVVSDADSEDFFKFYLHDFVRIVHKCYHSKKQEYETKEYELVASALSALVLGAEVDGKNTLIRSIAALHMIYETNRLKVLWFGHLVAHSPEVILQLTPEIICDRKEMILHLCAVSQTLSNFLAPLDKNEPASSLTPWLDEVRVSQNAISSILSLPSKSKKRPESRLKWDVIRVLRLFFEQVMIKYPSQLPVAYLIRLNLVVRDKGNFLETTTLNAIQSHLNAMEKAVKKKGYIKNKELPTFRADCHNYFVQVVSSLCFGGQSAPESNLINSLMDVQLTQDIDLVSPLIESKSSKHSKSNKMSVVKSSLLQLLLEHNSEGMKKHLKKYFMRSQEIFNGEVDEHFYLLFIWCFEDALCKLHSSRSSESRLEGTIEVLKQSHHVLMEYWSEPIVTVDYLESIAGIRYAIAEVACLLNSTDVGNKSLIEQQQQYELIQLAEEICTDSSINTTDFSASGEDVVGPAVYLLKLLVRRYGFPCLRKVSEQHQWIIPEGLITTDLDKFVQPFLIYEGAIESTKYSDLKWQLDEVGYGRRVDELIVETKDFGIKQAAILLLAIFEAITLGYSNPRRPLDIDSLMMFVSSVEAFSHDNLMLEAAKLLSENKQGGASLAQMTISPTQPSEYKTLGGIVVHTVAVVSSSSSNQILLPFVNMLYNPKALMDSFFLTMGESHPQEVKRSIDGQFYACPRGHPYFVGECGHPIQKPRCNTCGARIGDVNAAARLPSTTMTGHTLGKPDSRRGPPAPERSLSAPAVCIMRAIMHSAMLWYTLHLCSGVPTEIVALVKPHVEPENLPEFFWMHLKRDIEQLSEVIGRGLDETAIIIHLVLYTVLTSPSPTSDTVVAVNSLNSKNAREQWEKEFSRLYIQPILGDLDARINNAMNLIASDEQQNHDLLFNIVHEKVECKDPSIWSYKPKISLEQLRLSLPEKKLKGKCPILHDFLQVEHSLRATQYLPDIVKLQHCLYDLFNYRLNQNDARVMTIGQFLKNLKSENTCKEYREMIENLKKALSLVGDDLKAHARLLLEDHHCLPAITEDVPIEYLVPTTTGAGALTVSLVDYLVLTHNDFIEKCSSHVMEKYQSSWDNRKIPITHIHRCHLLDYEGQITSVVLSHSCYSLSIGKPLSVQYDYCAIEKHILDRFIYGKPRIISDIPQVVYRKDVYTAVALDAVRKKVYPQERLDSRAQKDIISELRTAHRIRDTLDIVDIVIGFLSSGGGKPEKPLGEYIDRILRMKKRSLSLKVRETCQLRHVLSLWEVLSVKLAKLTWLHEQEPFDLIDEKFLRKLTKTDDDNQVAALGRCLMKFDLDRLLGVLFEFIETYVRYSPDSESHLPLKTVLMGDQFEYLGMKAQLSVDFPESITLDQAIAVWKHVVLYQEKN